MSDVIEATKTCMSCGRTLNLSEFHRDRSRQDGLRFECKGCSIRNGPGATHGLRATYNRGCRCVACRWAAADDVAERSGRRTA